MMKLQQADGKIALVAGATRGAGRAIAIKLGETGATVYVTGRTTRKHTSPMKRKETIEETAELVTKAGGKGVPLQIDHTYEGQVQALVEEIQQNEGRLDIAVNDVWGGDPLTDWMAAVGDHNLRNGLQLLQQAVTSHIITTHYAVPLLRKSNQALLIEITDGTDYSYRGNFYYSLAKISNIHMASAAAHDLRKDRITACAVTPGFLRSEAMLDLFGVTEDNWQDGVKQDPHFIASETPFYLGEAIKHLSLDPNFQRFSGKVLSTWELSDIYNFNDADGRRPHWGNYYNEHLT
ncbi:Pyridoxal 4-dehydrogenase [Virgibacillus salexigens]|uniref:Pyridoxal 4-dehydrogenase n=1 Tax=Virgibacillus massiliensis TaxID=1462526 RepID=A0A024QCZ1_9BACI|nr:Pyridoxal 4-dehydrogenase [Virgibacillus massiliensis]